MIKCLANGVGPYMQEVEQRMEHLPRKIPCELKDQVRARQSCEKCGLGVGVDYQLAGGWLEARYW